MDFGSATSARVTISNMKEAQFLQDTAAERCSICYRPPELFQVSSSCDLDERTDQSPYDPLYERGNSVALAVQIGKISFPASSGQYSQELLNLVMYSFHRVKFDEGSVQIFNIRSRGIKTFITKFFSKITSFS